MEELKVVQRGQNIIMVIDSVVKTKRIVDKEPRDSFIASLKEIINNKKIKDKNNKLLSIFESGVKVDVSIIETVKNIKEKVKKVKVLEKKVKEQKSSPVDNTNHPTQMITLSLADLKALIQEEISKIDKSDYIKPIDKPVKTKSSTGGEY